MHTILKESGGLLSSRWHQHQPAPVAEKTRHQNTSCRIDPCCVWNDAKQSAFTRFSKDAALCVSANDPKISPSVSANDPKILPSVFQQTTQRCRPLCFGKGPKDVALYVSANDPKMLPSVFQQMTQRYCPLCFSKRPKDIALCVSANDRKILPSVFQQTTQKWLQ